MKRIPFKTLDISNKRITNVFNKNNSSEIGIASRDKRGHKAPTNETVQERVDLAREHFLQFPRYSSHNSRIQAPNWKYLDVNLNIKKCMISAQNCDKREAKTLSVILITGMYLTHAII